VQSAVQYSAQAKPVDAAESSDMNTCTRYLCVALLAGLVGNAVGCAPYLPPTVVPAVESADLEAFRAALKAYIDQTQPYRQDAASKGDAAPNQTSAAGSVGAVRLRQRMMAEAIQTKIRVAAQQGDVLSPAVADVIRRRMTTAFAGHKGHSIREGLEDQNEGLKGEPFTIAINQSVGAPRVPPVLMEILPQLPQQVEFAFSDRTLILRDVDADVVVDFIPLAFPVWQKSRHGAKADASTSRAAEDPYVRPVSTSLADDAAAPLFALPELAGSTTFALIGDSGSGDAAQKEVASAMVRYYTTARRFTFVLMLGDNLYDDDYQGEFSVPYQGLLDRGVLFYAAIGNHDRELEQHFKPFHMTDRLYFAFTEGNARFVALNSNHPADRAQLAWFDTAFGGTGTKWRIAFFHHPLFSSGEHAQESRDSIRPALEPALLANHVDVVFTGHDHLYERIAPQRGIRYFVSGGGGRNLYAFHKSAFDEVGFSVHHFMVVEIAGDQLFFEAVTPSGKTLDCGVLWRTPDAAAKGVDAATVAWQEGCRAAIAGTPRLTASAVAP